MSLNATTCYTACFTLHLILQLYVWITVSLFTIVYLFHASLWAFDWRKNIVSILFNIVYCHTLIFSLSLHMPLGKHGMLIKYTHWREVPWRKEIEIVCKNDFANLYHLCCSIFRHHSGLKSVQVEMDSSWTGQQV
jgi:hypothetical protein